MPEPIPKVKEANQFNFLTSIWIVPFIALMIAGWLAYQYFEDLGPEIEIIFTKNEGLRAGQSVVKFKNVPIGKVTKIYFKEGVEGVVVRVRMNSKASQAYMTEYAKFWIVKPEVGFSGISGLDTIISGTYIDVYSQKGGEFKDTYVGLSKPYQDTSKGKYFHLISKDVSHLSVGMPIYYENIKVGKVAYQYLSLGNKETEIILFIKNEYSHYIHLNSKFWVKSAMRLDVSKGKIDLDIAPLRFLVAGGIVFSSSGEYAGKPIGKDKIFTLYKTQTEAQSHLIGSAIKEETVFLLMTKESISGLSDGSVLRFEGFDVGKVVDISLSYNKKTYKMIGEVLVSIDTSVFKDKKDLNTSGKENFYQAIQEGLRAKITNLDPITGAQFIDLTFVHFDGQGKCFKKGKYTVLPMSSEVSTGIMASVTEILNTFNNLALDELLASFQQLIDATNEPIENTNKLILSLSNPIKKTDVILDALQKTMTNINTLTSKKSFDMMPDELNKLIKEMSQTLKETRTVVKGYDSNSLMKAQISQTLEILTKTSQEMKFFLRMLNRKPNSLIFGDN
jgi:paraquat-inducible protein B